jgi:hypothetical protein
VGGPNRAHGVAFQGIPWPMRPLPFLPTFLCGVVRVPPSPLYKEAPMEEENTQFPMSLELFSSCAPPISLSLSTSLSRVAPKWLRRSEGQLHRCTPSCCGNSRSDPNRCTSAISAGSEILEEIIVHRMCTSTMRCCPLWH